MEDENGGIVWNIAWKESGLEAGGIGMKVAAVQMMARLSREEGEGLAIADVEPGRITPSEDPPDGFWIPELPWLIRAAWGYQNLYGRYYYRRARRSGKLRVR
jgi:hypothetical protein